MTSVRTRTKHDIVSALVGAAHARRTLTDDPALAALLGVCAAAAAAKPPTVVNMAVAPKSALRAVRDRTRNENKNRSLQETRLIVPPIRCFLYIRPPA